MVNIPKVAIACQGGGSFAAFGAGALLRLLQPDHFARFKLVALSGTSGGALSAALAWRGLVSSGAGEARERCAGFWRALQARETVPADYLASSWDVWSARTPVLVNAMPYASGLVAESMLRRLLSEHLELEQLPTDAPRRGRPRLFIAATDVLSGDRVIFPGETLELDHVIASAAVPPLFRAVNAGGHWCWDAIFSTNAPVREFTEIDDRPDEIWVVQVNPQRREREPRTLREIKERSNELSGNLSLAQELYFIDRINQLLARHATLKKHYQNINIRLIHLDHDQVDGGIDIPSKLDRRRGFIEDLLEAGRSRAEWFFDERSAWPRESALPARSVVWHPSSSGPTATQWDEALPRRYG